MAATKSQKVLTFTLAVVGIAFAFLVFRFVLAPPLIVDRWDRKKMDIMSIEKAVMTYQVMYGEYPPDLETLTRSKLDGERPFLDSAVLNDPWGQPYGYDPKVLEEGRPLIWCKGPPGKNEPISNKRSEWRKGN